MSRTQRIALGLFVAMLLATAGFGLGTSDVDGVAIGGADVLGVEDASDTVAVPSGAGLCELGGALPRISSPVPTTDASLPAAVYCFTHCFTVTFNGTHVWRNCHRVCRVGEIA